MNETRDNPAPYNAEYVGTIEVVVLRCYSAPVEANHSFKRAATFAAPKGQAEKNKYVYPGVSSDSASNNDDTTSENGSDSGFGGLFDGSCDVSSNRLPGMAFGGDATWDNGENWDNGAQNTWNQGNNAPHSSLTGNNDNANTGWNLATANNRGPPQWDTRANSTSNHFSNDWNNPSQDTQEPVNDHGSRTSRNHLRPSSSHHNSPAPVNINEWPGGNPSQPSPAIIINVNHGPPSVNIGPPSVPDSGKVGSLPANFQPLSDTNLRQQGHNTSPNGSNRSGSNTSGSSNGSKKHNGGNSWQATARPNDAWGAEAPNMPGAWNASNDRPQGDTWNNDNANTGWNSESHRQNDQGQRNGDYWNNGGANSGGQGINGDGLNEQPQENKWTNEQMTAAYPDWASPTAQNIEQPNFTNDNNNNVQPQNPWVSGASNDQFPANQPNTWSNGNADATNYIGSGVSNGNGGKQSVQEQNSGGVKTNDVAGDVPASLFGGKVPVPASESAKREGPILAKYSGNGTGFTFGAQSSALRHPHAPMSPPVAAFVKPYWSTWNHTPAAEEELVVEHEPVEEPEEPEGPVYSVPADVAQRNNMSHQVQVGRPTVYLHRTSKPKYMDTHDNPYAAFTFHYRSRGKLKPHVVKICNNLLCSGH